MDEDKQNDLATREEVRLVFCVIGGSRMRVGHPSLRERAVEFEDEKVISLNEFKLPLKICINFGR